MTYVRLAARSKGIHPLEVARVSGYRAVQMLFRYDRLSAADQAEEIDC